MTPSKHILADNKFKITGERLNGAKRPPTLEIDFYRGNPNFKVWANVDSIKRPIEGRVSYMVFQMIMELLVTVSRSKENVRFVVDNHKRDKEKKQNVLESKIIFGRDNNGVYLAVRGADKSAEVPRFQFKIDWLHGLSASDGQELTDLAKSEIATRAWVNTINTFAPIAAQQSIAIYEAKSNGGGSSNNSYDDDVVSSNPRQSSDYDDDLPF